MQCAGMRRWAGGMTVLLAMAGPVGAFDDNQNPSLLGRLFRMGGSSAGSNSASGSNAPGSSSSSAASRLPYGGSYYNSPAITGSSYGGALPPGGASVGSTSHRGTGTPTTGPATPAPTPPLPTFGGLPETPPVTTSGAPAERLTPRSRVSHAITNADPILTRYAMGKSNDGSTFGMFMQIFADGTILDSEGVHHVRPADLKPILEVVQSGELYRMRGHCGAPSTDFVDYVHFIAYDRRLGRLQAHSFSYSGNPQGCDHVVRHLHNAIEALQTKISRPMTATAGAATAPAPINAGPTPAIPSSPTGGAVIPLSPAAPGH